MQINVFYIYGAERRGGAIAVITIDSARVVWSCGVIIFGHFLLFR